MISWVRRGCAKYRIRSSVDYVQVALSVPHPWRRGVVVACQTGTLVARVRVPVAQQSFQRGLFDLMEWTHPIATYVAKPLLFELTTANQSW